MSRIKILFACPDMEEAGAWKAVLSQDPDIQVMGDAADPIDTLLQAGTTHADIVIIDLPPAGREPGLYSHLLAEYPQVKVIAVSPDGSQAFMYERGIKRTAMRETSPQQLTGLFRSLLSGEDPVWRGPDGI